MSMILRKFQNHKTCDLRKFSSDCLNEEIAGVYLWGVYKEKVVKLKMSKRLLFDSGDSEKNPKKKTVMPTSLTELNKQEGHDGPVSLTWVTVDSPKM